MSSQKKQLSCIQLFLCTILVNFCVTASADVDENVDKALEERLHNIFVSHYSEPLAESDWFKIVENIENQDYQVKPGDTLWGISKIYFGDGHYWSKLWSINQTITNPHLIGVSDTVHFKSGSFTSEPSVSVDQGEETSENVEAVEASETTETVAEEKSSKPRRSVLKTYNLEPANEIPASFVEFKPIATIDTTNIEVQKRPKIVFQSVERLTEEILKDKPNVIGSVKSLGSNRIITGEVNRVILEASNSLTPGSTVSILDPNFGNTKRGYFVRVLATVKVVKSLGEDLFGKGLYEAEVVEQFDGIKKGAPVSTYAVQNMDLTPEGDPLDVPVTIVRTSEKNIWANGDIIFFDGRKKTLNVGDLININNKFTSDVEFFYHTGTRRSTKTRFLRRSPGFWFA
jgi:hypothetical protein